MWDPLSAIIEGLNRLLASFGVAVPGLDRLFYLVVFPGLLAIEGVLYFLILFERKVIARVNLRYGPLHVGRVGGVMQILADMLKFIQKEIIVPSRADAFLFRALPVLMVIVATVPIFVIPFGPNVFVTHYEASGLLVLAIFYLYPLLFMLVGWSANNKYTLFGGLRIAYQFLAYEIPLFLSVASVFALARSFDLIDIIEAQNSVWYLFLLPLGAIIFVISLLAELERKPFDIPEGEQEIVLGPLTEYTGINFLLMMMADRTKILITSAYFAAIFLGGYTLPFPTPLPPYLIMFAKQVIIAFFIVFLNAIFPRIRIDHVIRVGWKYLMPLSLINLVLAFFVGGLLT